MKKNPRILIDFEKISDPFSGLGQFCAHLKSYFDNSSLNIEYWIPGKLQKLAKVFPFILPRCDVFHAIHQDSPYVPKSSKTKFILTIHDLNALYENTSYGTGEFYKKNLQGKIDRANVITFISQFTQDEVQKNFHLNGKKQLVIYNGISLGKNAEAPANLPKVPFLFSVGTVVPKKNFHVLIDFLKLIPDYKIILAGTINNDYARDMQKKIDHVGLSDRFILVGTVNEAEKLWYYKNATAFIFPSLFEGFGLPVVEAMSLGLPLFISDKGPLPEIAGEDAYYFKNFEADHLREVFESGMKEFTPEKRLRLIERSKIYDWQKAAKVYLNIYSSI